MLKAQTSVKTEKASRYLKALCNHFNRKVKAEYNDTHGDVQFGWATCQMDAVENQLWIAIQAETDEDFERVKFVVSDHLARFAPDEALEISWIEAS
ncbi:hypothetical protein MASR2M15_19430 [Anaerolineales bacterium]